MNKSTLVILYLATILTIFTPTVELIHSTILPGVERLTQVLEEVGR